MKKRLLSAVMVIGLIASLLTACAPGDKTTNGSADSSVSSADASSSASSGTAGGDYSLPLCTPGSQTLTMLTYQNWHASSYFDSANGLEIENQIEKITGVKIKWECVASGDYNTVAQTRLASGQQLPDIVRVPNGSAGVAEYSKQGLLVNMSQYINDKDTPNILKLFNDQPLYKAYCTSPDGNIYGFPHAEFDINNYVVMWDIIRKDWLDKLGLQMPKTIDELHDVLVAFRDKDPNGNGKKDEIPLGYQNDAMYGLYSLKEAFGFNNTDVWSVKDGKVSFDLMDDKFLDCLTTLNKWYKEGLLNPTTDSSDSDTLIAQDRLGAQTITSMDNVVSKNDMVKPANKEGNYVFLPLLTNSKYPDNVPTVSKRQSWHDYYSVTIDCKNPKLAVQWMDWVYANPDSATLRYWGIEGETYTVKDSKKEFTDAVTKSGTSAIDVMRKIGGWPNFVGNEQGEPFMAMYKGTYCEKAYNEFKDKMTDRVPIAIGTPEESKTYSEKWPDIETYVKENVVNFITGNKPLSEWKNYTDTLKSMGIDDVTAVKQAWYDRVNKK